MLSQHLYTTTNEKTLQKRVNITRSAQKLRKGCETNESRRQSQALGNLGPTVVATLVKADPGCTPPHTTGMALWMLHSALICTTVTKPAKQRQLKHWG
jgi:hypothetical protein